MAILLNKHSRPPIPTLGRVEHWATRAYHNFLKERANRPFEWGTHDCALFAADGVLAITGVDIAADFRGKYTDGLGALEAIRTVCGGQTVADAAAWCAAKHGLYEWPHPLLARRGDLVVLEDAGRTIAGLIHLSGRHVAAAGATCLKRISILDGGGKPVVLRAWHV